MADFKSLPRQRYTPEFKLQLVRMALKTLEEKGSVAALVRQHNVNDNLLFNRYASGKRRDASPGHAGEKRNRLRWFCRINGKGEAEVALPVFQATNR